MTIDVEPVSAPGADGLRRFRARVAYQGTDFHGWAAQPGLRTVEGELAPALARVLRQPSIRLTCAGRTDAGVHALGQVVHFDTTAAVDAGRLGRSTNGVLPPDIRISDIRPAPPHFDARFAALWRHYRYLVADGVPDPMARHTVLAVRRGLDVAAMDEAAQALCGVHDFGSFCRPRSGATTVRSVLCARWNRRSDGVVVLEIRADAFCHSMVRSVVGASLEVGAGRRSGAWLAGLVQRPGRADAAPVAPPHGLVLVDVGYPDDPGLAERVAVARARRQPAGPAAG